jgi:hypothetical protein
MEDHNAAWAWLVLAVSIIVYVAAFDIWAARTHHQLMTYQFRDWLFNPVTGPFVAAGWVGIFTGLTYHWFLKRKGS